MNSTRLRLVPSPDQPEGVAESPSEKAGARLPAFVARTARSRRRAPWRPARAAESHVGGARLAPHRRLHRELVADENGAVTAEYAIVIMAAVAFAGLLVAIMRSSEIRAMLVQLVENALGSAG